MIRRSDWSPFYDAGLTVGRDSRQWDLEARYFAEGASDVEEGGGCGGKGIYDKIIAVRHDS